MYDRIIVVRCPNVIPAEAQDKHLLDRMFAERNGIVHKLVSALQRVIANRYRFVEPECVTAEREHYMLANENVAGFIKACICKQTGTAAEVVTASQIYMAYKNWCAQNGVADIKSQKEFRNGMSAYTGCTYSEITTHCDKGTIYKEFTLSEEAKKMYLPA